MAQMRETPYAAFNFLVELQPGQGKEVQAGFSEVSGLNAEVTVAEYRAGNSTVNYVHKLPGIHKAGDVTLKRGVIGAQNLYEWLEASRSGRIKDAKREIVIKLLSEDRADTVVSWKLRGAMPIKWTGPTLTAKGGGDVAIEELVLSVETVEQE
ncbi:MAG TPA: phage tail protein [Zoogloea sp.]|uniref:phage tail protein n=1 Tax=Zoogloea sp. TaxID=49181 RepID=UPI002CF34FDA|nr:phage tail protein [Zoogloea sp.]HMV17253.1 phage tail protein [Rhodocyclaceae bacterium]HMV62593.1 phage tail protein [Rhodocyclaceae bacterium]HMW51062.1 phage tail protein [Rhodocyclaceae bacterium]HMY49535.1 phage tail protein [Rhodocyclaceae bacterium]HMZ75720.1 phage tail protein [Rhodocyclaceae bacterium]